MKSIKQRQTLRNMDIESGIQNSADDTRCSLGTFI